MPGDPKKCRAHAMRCAELASTAKSREWKAVLLDLSRSWGKLAEGLERAEALQNKEKMDFEKPA